jgi:ATP-binding cassette subfamily B protein
MSRTCYSLEKSQGAVRFSGVRFAYPTRPETPVFKVDIRRVHVCRLSQCCHTQHLSFEVKPGECVAVVGASGVGKTSILSLLLRMYEYDDGRIEFDGHDLRTLNAHWLRTQIALVPQEPILFACR